MPAPVPAPAARAAAPLAAETPLDAIEVTFTEPPSPVSEPVAEVHEPTPTIIATTLGEVEGLLLDRIVDDAGRKAPRGEAAGASSATKRGRKGREPAADKPLATSVDDLLRSFSVSAYDADGAMKATQQLFFADLDAAPADPAEPVASAAEEPPPMAPAARDASIVPARARDRRAAFGSRSVALLAVGLVLAGLIGHYAPALFSL